MTFLIGKPIQLNAVLKDEIYILTRIEPDYLYENSKKTDTVVGHKYEIVDTVDFNKFKVKIKGQTKPLMTNEALQEMREGGKRVLVELVDGVDTLYIKIENKGRPDEKTTVEDSFSAKDILLVETNN